MSVLMGKNGYEVGSVDYFKNLNEKSIVGDLMREFCGSSSSTQYSKAVDGVCKRAQDAIYDIHSDLKKHAAFLRYFPKSERDSLTLVVKGLDELLKLGSYTRNSTANACVSLLTLQSSETKPKSRESMQNLEAAAKLVKNGGKVRVTYATGYDLIKRAASDGMQRAAGSDLNKQAFFNAVVGNRSKEFVQDLWALMQYQKEKHRLTGRCGKVICSRDYMDKIEAQVFGKAQSWVGDCESYYDEVHEGLQAILLTLSMDYSLFDGYLIPDKVELTQGVLNELSKCGFALADTMIKEIPKKRLIQNENVKKLQEYLILFGYSEGEIVADGYYNDETQKAVQLFLQNLTMGVAPTLTLHDPLHRSVTGLFVESFPQTKPKPGLTNPDIYDFFPMEKLPDGTYKVPFLMKDTIKTKLVNGEQVTVPGKIPVIRPDTPEMKHGGKPLGYHWNVNEEVANSSPIVQSIMKTKGITGDHAVMDEEAYLQVMKVEMKGKTNFVKIGGKILYAAGVILDALEVYQAVQEDSQDGKIGIQTYGTVIKIGLDIVLGATGWAVGDMIAAALVPTHPVIGLAIELFCSVGFTLLGDLILQNVLDVTQVAFDLS